MESCPFTVELYRAIIDGRDVCDIESLLNKKGMDAVLHSDTGIQLFESALNSGQTKIASLLLSRGVSCKQEPRGNSYLHIAILNEDFNFASQLISLGADIEAVDSAGNSPLLLAIYMDSSDIAELLLTNGARPSYYGLERIFRQNPLGLAVERNDLDIVKLLLNYREIMETREVRHALYKAIYNSADRIVKYFISCGVHLDDTLAEKTSILHITAEYGCALTVEYILEQGLGSVNNVNSRGRSPLHSVAINSNNISVEPEIVGTLENIVNNLLKYGAEIDMLDSQDMTALMYSLKCHNHTVSVTLMEHGADVTMMKNNNTLLLWALESSELCANCELVELILKHGGDKIIDHVNSLGVSALIHCIDLKNHFYLATLLNYFPNLDTDYSDGTKSFNKLISKFHNNDNILDRLSSYLNLMEVANLHMSSVSKQALRAVIPVKPKAWSHCEEEVKIMQKQNLINSLTAFEFLRKPLSNLLSYEELYSDNIFQSFKSYPRHEYIMRKKLYILKEKLVRRDLLRAAVTRFISITGFSLPLLIVEKIFGYLSNDELKFILL